jgi:hypothetical protein
MDKIVLEYTFVSTTYTTAGKQHIAIGNFQVAVVDRALITGGAGNKVSIVEPTKLLNTDGYNLHIASALNQPLAISTTDSTNFASGNGTMEVKMWYTIRSFG